MSLSAHDAISILDLAFYIPSSLLSLYLCFRHDLRQNIGWFFLVPFTLVKIAAASVQLATINSSDGEILRSVSAMLSQVAIAPLLLTILGHLQQIQQTVARAHPTRIATVHLVLLRVPTITGLVLAAHGGTASTNHLDKTGHFKKSAMSIVAVGLYLVIFAAIVAITCRFLLSRSHIRSAERRFLFAITASLPFIFIPILYAVLQASEAADQFRVLVDSVALMACMSTVPEMVVVVIYGWVGLTTPREPKREVRKENMSWSIFFGRRCVSENGSKDPRETSDGLSSQHSGEERLA
ncbi:hypothetical protein BKA61DRAFT_619723 [Leptodontidium sp. MPI-SDFR-AT-0119]|nr:hypothetical protein BKA61DRAFT_619723 [Leptodontidium sp. MPI-SDFR-AT-0119]